MSADLNDAASLLLTMSGTTPASASFLEERRLRTIKMATAAAIAAAITTAIAIPAFAPVLRPPEELDLATAAGVEVESADTESGAGVPVSAATPVDELLASASSNPEDVTLKHGIWRVNKAASTKVYACVKGYFYQTIEEVLTISAHVKKFSSLSLSLARYSI